MSLISKIEKITTWYKSLKRDFSGVSDLMYARQQLSGLLADFAIQIASLVEQRNGCEFQRKTAHAVPRCVGFRVRLCAAWAYMRCSPLFYYENPLDPN